MPTIPTYTVLVGNIGVVHTTTSLRDARCCARTYVDQSKAGIGRAAGESVTVFEGLEILDEFIGANEYVNETED